MCSSASSCAAAASTTGPAWSDAASRTCYIEELDGAGLAAGLEIKPPQMWADHVCDVPFRQWSVGNEAHGVLLDDPD